MNIVSIMVCRLKGKSVRGSALSYSVHDGLRHFLDAMCTPLHKCAPPVVCNNCADAICMQLVL